MKYIVRAVAGCLAFVGLLSAANSATFDLPPLVVGNKIAANDTVNNNIWIGEAQSFTAQDSNVLFGFYLYESAQVPTDVLFSLYAGDGTFSTLLSQRPATLLSGTPQSPVLLSVDFSSTTLTVNSKYTVVITMPTMTLPPIGTQANVGVMFAGSNGSGNPNPYAGGSFYYFGSSINPSFFLDRDIAFRVTPVPEPAVYALLISGLAVLAVRRATRFVKPISNA